MIWRALELLNSPPPSDKNDTKLEKSSVTGIVQIKHVIPTLSWFMSSLGKMLCLSVYMQKISGVGVTHWARRHLHVVPWRCKRTGLCVPPRPLLYNLRVPSAPRPRTPGTRAAARRSGVRGAVPVRVRGVVSFNCVCFWEAQYLSHISLKPLASCPALSQATGSINHQFRLFKVGCDLMLSTHVEL